MARIAGNFDQSITFNRKVSEATRKIQHFAETSRSLAEAAHRQVAYLRNEDMDENGQKNLVLARIFLSLPYTELPPEYQREIESGGSLPDPEDRFLCLMGTAGDEPDWNDPLRSRGHKYMKLPDREEDLVQMPMIQKVFAEFGVPYSAILRPDSSREHSVEGYFLADDPAASPYIPDKGFVSDYGIRSQVSIGGVLPSGSIFTMFLFSRQKLTHDMAEAISVYGPVLQMTFKEFDDEGSYW